MNKLIFAVLLFLLMVALSVFMHQRNGLREVRLEGIRWDENRPRLIAQDSVNKLLKVALSDSVSAFKRGLNLREIEQTLNQNAWVEDAQSFVFIDGGIGVHVTSKLPIVRIEGDSSYYLDASGAPFPLSKNQSVVVPIFYGNPTAEQRLLLVDAVQQAAQDSFMSDHVVAYEWLPEGLTVEPRQEEYQIVLGTPNQLEQKFNKYKAFYAKMQDSAVLKTYKQVNLSFHGQVVCSK
ncbi:MAG: cell division protein FtsQ/DivIB [Flavobacteriaceae bacterium]